LTQSAIRGQFRKIATSCPFGLNKARASNFSTWSPFKAPQEQQRGHGKPFYNHLTKKQKRHKLLCFCGSLASQF